MMVDFIRQIGAEVGTSSTGAEESGTERRKYLGEAHFTTQAEGPSGITVSGARVRYGETQSVTIGRRSVPITDTKPFEIGSKDVEINELLNDCIILFERMLETENIIERENLYRTLNEHLVSLFELRSTRERAFGQLLVLLLGITRNTSSEFFSDKQFQALARTINLTRKIKIAEHDLQEAERLLSVANFDLFRPLRGVFENDDD